MSIVHYTPAEARDFFERLAVYSAAFVRETLPHVHSFWPSKNHYEEWRDGAPIGNVLHYTAGTRFGGTIRHFVLEHRASANWVVARGLDPKFSELRRQLELDRDLRADVVQVIPPDQPSWHAGWVNRFLTGIEVRNAGILRAHPKKMGRPGALAGGMSRDDFFKYGNLAREDLDFFWWPDGWTSRFEGEVTHCHGSWWETWTRGSVATVVTLLRYLNALYPGKMRPEWMLAHHNVLSTKSDCVYAPDLASIRSSVLTSREHVDNLEWLSLLDDAEDTFEDEDDPWMLRDLSERQADRAEEDVDDFHVVDGRVDRPEEAREALRRLGYHVEGDDSLLTSVRIYQQSRGLDVDGDVGSQTYAALDKELKSWRLR